jgi:hypothetical protein
MPRSVFAFCNKFNKFPFLLLIIYWTEVPPLYSLPRCKSTPYLLHCLIRSRISLAYFSTLNTLYDFLCMRRVLTWLQPFALLLPYYRCPIVPPRSCITMWRKYCSNTRLGYLKALASLLHSTTIEYYSFYLLISISPVSTTYESLLSHSSHLVTVYIHSYYNSCRVKNYYSIRLLLHAYIHSTSLLGTTHHSNSYSRGKS